MLSLLMLEFVSCCDSKPGKMIKYDQYSGRLQWKLLNVVTMGQRDSDNIIWMITMSQSAFYIKYLTESDLRLGKSGSIWSHELNDIIISANIKRLPSTNKIKKLFCAKKCRLNELNLSKDLKTQSCNFFQQYSICRYNTLLNAQHNLLDRSFLQTLYGN